MTEFFFDYGLFALKLLTTLVLLLVVFGLVGGFGGRLHLSTPGRLEVVKLNERLEHDRDALRSAMLEPQVRLLELKAKEAEEKSQAKAKKKMLKRTLKAEKKAKRQPFESTDGGKKVYVLDFVGDLQASAIGHLRREITALLTTATEGDEIIVRLESGGGMVHSYGLAASQLQRIKNGKIKLTVCVDKVAASGGYMMACVADHLLAAPFAVIGSIGVVAQLPNFHRLLKKHDVDFDIHTAGKFKRTLTLFGENTEQGRNKFVEELEDTHELFKGFVMEQRPQLDINTVATGEVWYGRRAIQEKLIDGLQASDEYIAAACKSGDVFEVRYVEKSRIQDKLSAVLETSLNRVVSRWWSRSLERPVA